VRPRAIANGPLRRPSNADPMSAPNILLIITDQHRADHLGHTGTVRFARRISTVSQPAAGRRSFLRLDADLHAESLDADDRAHAVGARRPAQRHSALARCDDVSRSSARARLSHGAPRQVALAKHDRDSAHVPRSRCASVAASPPFELREARHRIHDEDRYEQENSKLWLDPKHHMQLPFYGFEDVSLCTNHGDQVDAEYGRWLRANLPDAEQLRGAKGAAPAPDFIAPQAWRTRIPKSSTDHLRCRPDHRLARTTRLRRRRPAVFRAVLVSRPASSVYAAGTLLVDVRSGRHRTPAVVFFRCPAAAARRVSARRTRQRHGRHRYPSGLRGERTADARVDGAHVRHDHDDRRCDRPRPRSLDQLGLAETRSSSSRAITAISWAIIS